MPKTYVFPAKKIFKLMGPPPPAQSAIDFGNDILNLDIDENAKTVLFHAGLEEFADRLDPEDKILITFETGAPPSSPYENIPANAVTKDFPELLPAPSSAIETHMQRAMKLVTNNEVITVHTSPAKAAKAIKRPLKTNQMTDAEKSRIVIVSDDLANIKDAKKAGFSVIPIPENTHVFDLDGNFATPLQSPPKKSKLSSRIRKFLDKRKAKKQKRKAGSAVHTELRAKIKQIGKVKQKQSPRNP